MSESAPVAPGAPPRRRPWLAPLVLAVGLLLAYGALVSYRLVSVASDLRSANRLVDQAEASLDRGDVRGAVDKLTSANVRLLRANRALNSLPELQVLRSVPVASQNLAAVDEGVTLAMKLTGGARAVLVEAQTLQGPTGRLEVPLRDGQVPLEVLVRVQRELAAFATDLPGATERGSDRFVLPLLSEARDDLYQEMSGRRDRVNVLARSLEVLADMAGANGDRRYLIAVANTAEMRGSGGMILSYGVLESSAGEFELPSFGRIDELVLEGPIDATSLALPDDLIARWSGFDLTERWRNATVGADFTVNGPLLEAMYEAKTGAAVDGVIQIDPNGLAAILEGVGPISIPEVGAVTADNVVDITLNSAYVQFPGIDDRSDVLGDIAEATFRKLIRGRNESLRPLATALVTAVEGRHVLMHTKPFSVMGQVSFFDAGGALPDPELLDVFHLTVQNVSANKLDYFLDTRLELLGERRAGEVGVVTAKVTIANAAPVGVTDPLYVYGPRLSGQVAGDYRGIVSLYLPAGSSLDGVGGDPAFLAPTLQTEGGRPVVGFTVDVPAGTARTFELELRLPPAPAAGYQVLVIPSPRVRPTTVALNLESTRGVTRGEAVLTGTWRFQPGRPPEQVPLVELR